MREESEFQVVIVRSVTIALDMVGMISRQVKVFNYPAKLQVLLFPGSTVLSLKQNTKYVFEIRRADGIMK